jgi:hypothetical protein
MDDAFSLVAARMPRSRRLSPFDVRVIVLGVVATLLIATFAIFVVSQQRAADARRANALATQRAAETARAQATVATTAPAADGVVVAGMLDRQAKDAAVGALEAATRLAAEAGPNAVTTASLSATQPGILFVDGPSTAPSVVSVYAGPAGWAAAVHGGDTCYWVARAPGGRVRYGSGTGCTGLAALAADLPSW